MPAKWQTWLPRVIDAWCGSSQVNALSDGAYRAYDFLCMEAWQSEDGKLPDDDSELARRSRSIVRLPDGTKHNRWPEYSDEVRALFVTDGNGRLYSARLLMEWKRARVIHDRKSAGASSRNTSRAKSYPDTTKTPHRVQSVSVPSTATATKTPTATEPKATPLAPRNRAAAASPLFSSPPVVTLLLNSGEEFPVTADDIAEWSKAFPGVDILPELQKMRLWCLGNPRNRKTKNGISKFIMSWLERTQNKGGIRNHGNANAETAGHLSTLARFAARRGIEGRGGADEVGNPAPGSAE